MYQTNLQTTIELLDSFSFRNEELKLNLVEKHNFLQASYMIVDEMHEEHPELLKDQYWDEVVPKELPYTVASEHYRKEEPKGSADHYKIKTQDAMYANLITPRKTIVDDMYADYVSLYYFIFISTCCQHAKLNYNFHFRTRRLLALFRLACSYLKRKNEIKIYTIKLPI